MVTVTNGWAIGQEALWRTTDGGATWIDVTPPGVAVSGPSPGYFLDASFAWLGWSRPDGSVLVFRTADGGRSWENTRVRVIEADTTSWAVFPFGFLFLDRQQGWLVVGPESMNAPARALFQTSDGGRTWSKIATKLPIFGLLGFATPATGWAVARPASGTPAAPATPEERREGLLYATRDGGRTWQYQPLPLPSAYDARSMVAPVARLSFSSPQEGALPVVFLKTQQASTSRLVLYLTRDGGQSWIHTTPLPLGTSQTGAITGFWGARHGWVVAGSELATTGDGGEHWTRFTPTGITVQSDAYDVRGFTFISPEIGWANVVPPRNPNAASLLKTTDGGRTWATLQPRKAGR